MLWDEGFLNNTYIHNYLNAYFWPKVKKGEKKMFQIGSVLKTLLKDDKVCFRFYIFVNSRPPIVYENKYLNPV